VQLGFPNLPCIKINSRLVKTKRSRKGFEHKGIFFNAGLGKGSEDPGFKQGSLLCSLRMSAFGCCGVQVSPPR
jgi:hypothetical protein